MERNKLKVLIMASVRWYNASAHYAFFLAQELKKAGVEVFIMGLPGSPIIEKARKSGIKYIGDINLEKNGPSGIFKNIYRFRSVVAKNKFDIIHPHFSRDQSLAFFSFPLSRPPVVRTRSESRTPVKNFLNRLLYKRSADFYTATAGFMLPGLEALGVPEQKVAVIPLAIDYKEFVSFRPTGDLRKALGIPADKIVVTCAGRLHKIKGVDIFLKSYSLLKNKKRFHYIISGEEIDVTIEFLKGIAEKDAIENITFLDRLDDIRDLLYITDIGVIPSMGSEAVCRVALEMFSFGIPVVGSDINSIPETIAEYEGAVVRPGNPGEIARSLDDLGSRQKLKKLGDKIRVKLEKNSPGKFALEYISIYRKCLGQGH